MHSILIARTDKIGDFIQSIPAYATAKAMFPQAKIYALTSTLNKNLALALPSIIDEVICYDEYEYKQLKAKLKSLNLDCFIALMTTRKIAFLAWCSGAKIRIAPYSKPHSWLLYNHGLRQARSLSLKSEAQYNIDLIAHLDPLRFKQVGFKLCKLELQEEKFKLAQELMLSANLPLNQDFILINPFTGGTGVNLSLAQYGQLINAIGEHVNANIVLLGIDNQEHLTKCQTICSLVKSEYKNRVYTLLNPYDLMVASCIVQKCKVFLGPSTGITHIAGNLQKACVCLYSSHLSNGYQRWQLFGNDQEKAFIFDETNIDPQSKLIISLNSDVLDNIVKAVVEYYYA